jgi:hypothetical protein
VKVIVDLCPTKSETIQRHDFPGMDTILENCGCSVSKIDMEPILLCGPQLMALLLTAKNHRKPKSVQGESLTVLKLRNVQLLTILINDLVSCVGTRRSWKVWILEGEAVAALFERRVTDLLRWLCENYPGPLMVGATINIGNELRSSIE